jgi:hypothetical protein
MSTIRHIEKLIESLSASEIADILATTTTKGQIRRVDTSRRMRRLGITDLYFSSAPRPKDSFKEYSDHAECIRQQCISGVDL